MIIAGIEYEIKGLRVFKCVKINSYGTARANANFMPAKMNRKHRRRIYMEGKSKPFQDYENRYREFGWEAAISRAKQTKSGLK